MLANAFAGREEHDRIPLRTSGNAVSVCKSGSRNSTGNAFFILYRNLLGSVLKNGKGFGHSLLSGSSDECRRQNDDKDPFHDISIHGIRRPL